MDISLLLVDCSEIPPEGTGDNGGGIQWERNLLFFPPKRTQISQEHRKTSSSNGHPWVKPLCPLPSDCPPLSVDCFHLSPTKSQSTCLCRPSSAPIIHLLESFCHRDTHRNRALLPCARSMHENKDRQTMQIKLLHRADQALCK